MIIRWAARLAVALTRWAHEHSCHMYLSTGCLHGDHSYCRQNTGKSGRKRPAACKFCQAPCICLCHQEPARA